VVTNLLGFSGGGSLFCFRQSKPSPSPTNFKPFQSKLKVLGIVNALVRGTADEGKWMGKKKMHTGVLENS
jgi:hypothetical protein